MTQNVSSTGTQVTFGGTKPFSQATKDLQQDINAAIDKGQIPGPKLKEDGLEGPKTRAKASELVAYRQALPPAMPNPPAAAQDQVAVKDPTVGEFVEQQIANVGHEFKQDAKLAAIMLSPLGPVAAVVQGRHMNQAREQIAKLPMDPQGKWKVEAAKILDTERKAAREEILALPAKVGQGIVDGAAVVGAGVVAGVVATGEAAQYVGQKTVEGAQYVGQKAGEGAEFVADTVEKGVDLAVQHAEKAYGGVLGVFKAIWDWAKEAIPKAFRSLFEDVKFAAVAVNPIFAAHSGTIMAKHMGQAYEQVMKLPMDAEGKWKDEAAKIVAAERAAAREEITQLPAMYAKGLLTGVKTAYDTTAAGVEAATQAVNATVDMATEAVVNEVERERNALGGALKKAGEAIAGE